MAQSWVIDFVDSITEEFLVGNGLPFLIICSPAINPFILENEATIKIHVQIRQKFPWLK